MSSAKCAHLAVVAVHQLLNLIDENVADAVERLSLRRKHLGAELPQDTSVPAADVIDLVERFALHVLQVRVVDGGDGRVCAGSLHLDNAVSHVRFAALRVDAVRVH